MCEIHACIIKMHVYEVYAAVGTEACAKNCW
jgi:hypothetical protein